MNRLQETGKKWVDEWKQDGMSVGLISMPSMKPFDSDTNMIMVVKTQAAATESLAKVVHQQKLDNVYEGSILRTNDVYKCGRSWSLRKF